MLVYFFRRLKSSEKEAEEDWSLSRRSLFVSPEPVEQKAEGIASADRDKAGAVDQAVTREFASISTGEIPEGAGEKVTQEPQATRELRTEYPPPPETETTDASSIRDVQPLHIQSEPEPLREARPTEVLASPQPENIVRETEAIDEAAHFDDDVWAGLEIHDQQNAGPTPPFGADQNTQLLGSNEMWPAMERPSIEQSGEQQTRPPLETAEPSLDARIEHRTGREQFDPPRIERVSHREPFEPPTIKPLTPREQSTFIENQKDSPTTDDLYASGPRDRKASTSGPTIYGANVDRLPSESQRRPGEQRLDERQADERRADAQGLYEDRPRGVESATPSSMRPASADRQIEPSVAAGQTGRGRRSPAGSILGLPAEASREPLILGDSSRSREEMGIGALSNYGRPAEKDGGRGGTIALLAVVLIVGGGLLAYLFVPSVHSAANAWVAHLRGTDVEEARRLAMTPKAVIYPRVNSEVIKNQVKIKGAIENMWTEPLENLTVEVALQRGGDAPPQTINVAVSPNPLPQNQRGTFDFEYDGKRDTGFIGYKITKLLSNGNEVKFTSPNAQK
ncbi:MAG TPA: hypothetical protein VJZ26_10525 [Blastocatellia bacterium]|nr:hypothetical protein [Blastocatellia bacterium]